MGIDIVGPFPVTPNVKKYIVVATKYLTKWPEAHALKWDDQVFYLRNQIYNEKLDLLTLLQYYYFIEERLAEKFWRSDIRRKIYISTYAFAKLSNENFETLVEKARVVKEQEVEMLLEGLHPSQELSNKKE
ncbi:4220_t:CDS:2, partial [Cetraspora pellucida]